MNVIVCVKQVPNPELQFRVREDGRDIQRDALTYQINGPDEYALEEAVRIKEKHGGKVTAVSAGPERVTEVLRQAMAKGADEAYRVELPEGMEANPYATSRVLARAIERMDYDLVLTGVQSEDFAHASTGPLMASFLGIPHASVVAKVELEDGRAKVYRELEGGLQQVLRLRMPALLTIQFGINEPRYASVAAILKATRQPIHQVTLGDLGLSPDDLMAGVSVRRMYVPEETHKAEIIEGPPEEVARRLATILRERGFTRGG
jgi:electron transfer flavoprotein beta subunit